MSSLLDVSHNMLYFFLIYQNVFASKKKKILNCKYISSFALGHSFLNCRMVVNVHGFGDEDEKYFSSFFLSDHL